MKPIDADLQKFFSKPLVTKIRRAPTPVAAPPAPEEEDDVVNSILRYLEQGTAPKKEEDEEVYF